MLVENENYYFLGVSAVISGVSKVKVMMSFVLLTASGVTALVLL